jgi:hypothetical protein
MLGVTAAGGLGILVGGGSPRESLHLLYAVLAFAAVPVATSFARRSRPRREGIIVMVGAVVALVLVVRLFQTA